jgi:NAD-reducing hydrogenase small subunit
VYQVAENKKVKIATVWLCGCAGCHMSFLDLDERLLDLAAIADLTTSPVTDIKEVPEVDLALVEGGIGNEENLHILKKFRAQAKILVSLGDCAGFGCIPMMRNNFSNEEVLDRAYALTESTVSGAVPTVDVPKLTDKVRPIHEFVKVDAHIPGCPPTADVIWYAVTEILAGRTPKFDSVPISYN